MKVRNFKFWTLEEDNLIAADDSTPGLALAGILKKTKSEFANRSLYSIYQRILYVRFMKKENRKILYRKTGVPLGTKRETYKPRYVQVRGRSVDVEEITEQPLGSKEKAPKIKEVVLPKGMSVEFTGKKISITDTYIKIYI